MWYWLALMDSPHYKYPSIFNLTSFATEPKNVEFVAANLNLAGA